MGSSSGVGPWRDASVSSPSAVRRRRWWVAIPLILLLATGCSATVGGAARPAPNLAPRSVHGQILNRVLVGKSALSRIVRQPMELDPRYPPVSGRPPLPLGDSDWFQNCLGVAVIMQGAAYRSADVQDVALETWRPVGPSPAAVTGVKEAAISLPTAADANALFATFSRQWQGCEGKTVPVAGGALPLKVKVSHVQSAGSVVAATISMHWNAPVMFAPAIPAARAIGVRDNCLIEVEVDFLDTLSASREGSGDVNTSALDIAQVMRDKVTALS